VLPSEWEATGIVLLEAMAKGNVIITSDGNEAARMVVEHRANGFIYKYGDVQSLAYALSQVVNDPKLRAKMIDLNIQKAKEFTWEAIFPKYLSVVEKTLKSKQTPKAKK
jgi:glycosyltransferase involved in cell wall biosynthesis